MKSTVTALFAIGALLFALPASAQSASESGTRGLNFTVLHDFTGRPTDGSVPIGWLVADGAGALYGVTQQGGQRDNGTVFVLRPPSTPGGKWTRRILHSFGGRPRDGAIPVFGLVRDTNGALYGTTAEGGVHNQGIVYRLKPSNADGTRFDYEVLHEFSSRDGSFNPSTGVVLDDAGNLYGGTRSPDTGTLFKLTPTAMAPWTFSVLYAFKGAPDDGNGPEERLLVQGNALIGATHLGGSDDKGTIFMVPTTGASQADILTSFKNNGRDPRHPYSGVIAGPAGELYGTTRQGTPANLGAVFKLTPPVAPSKKWTRTTLWEFSGAEGAYPLWGLVRDKRGSLYGTTLFGGANGVGVVFRLRPPAAGHTDWTFLSMHDFVGPEGGLPDASVLLGPGGVIYGTAAAGGNCGCGTAFMIEP